MSTKKSKQQNEIPGLNIFRQELSSTEVPEENEIENKKQIHPQIILDPDVDVQAGITGVSGSFREAAIYLSKKLINECDSISEQHAEIHIENSALALAELAALVCLKGRYITEEHTIELFESLMKKALFIINSDKSVSNLIKNYSIVFESDRLNRLSNSFKKSFIVESKFINKNKKGD